MTLRHCPVATPLMENFALSPWATCCSAWWTIPRQLDSAQNNPAWIRYEVVELDESSCSNPMNTVSAVLCHKVCVSRCIPSWLCWPSLVAAVCWWLFLLFLLLLLLFLFLFAFFLLLLLLLLLLVWLSSSAVVGDGGPPSSYSSWSSHLRYFRTLCFASQDFNRYTHVVLDEAWWPLPWRGDCQLAMLTNHRNNLKPSFLPGAWTWSRCRPPFHGHQAAHVVVPRVRGYSQSLLRNNLWSWIWIIYDHPIGISRGTSWNS